MKTTEMKKLATAALVAAGIAVGAMEQYVLLKGQIIIGVLRPGFQIEYPPFHGEGSPLPAPATPLSYMCIYK